jgi:N4-gp56 family major capsid protein
MSDTYTGQGTLDYAKTAYDLMAYFALRPELYFDAAADVEPSNQSMAGSTVQFTIQSDLAVASTALSESSDVSAVAMADTTVSLTLAEYGNAVLTTALLRGTSFLDVDKLVTNVVGWNAGISLDTLAQIQLKGGTNVNYSIGTGATPTARNMLTPLNTIGAADIRNARATLTRNFVQRIGGYYLAFIHPDVSYDLQGQTGTNTWSDPHAYSAPEEIWQGELGAFQGFRFIETPRAPIFADAGSSTTDTDVYRTICLGRQALAKAYSYVDGNGAYPTVVPGPITDHLRRFVPWGWYWLGAYGIFRQSALLGIESASSIGHNAAAGSN